MLGFGFSSSHLLKKILLWHFCVPKSSFQGISIHLIVVRKDNPPAILVLHLNMAAFPVYFYKTEALQRRMNLPARQYWQFHESSTTSAPLVWGNWSG